MQHIKLNSSLSLSGQAAQHSHGVSPAETSFVACHLARPFFANDRLSSWGLWISLSSQNAERHGPSLVVGGVDSSVFQSLQRWTWVTATPPDASIIWTGSCYSFDSQLSKAYFTSKTLFDYHSSPSLQPGDVIVAINGLPVSAFGESMASIVVHLRQCSELFLVAVRCHSRPAQIPTRVTNALVQNAASLNANNHQVQIRRDVVNHFASVAIAATNHMQSTPNLHFHQSAAATNVGPRHLPVVTPPKSPRKVHKAACAKPEIKRQLWLPIPKPYVCTNLMFVCDDSDISNDQTTTSENLHSTEKKYLPYCDNNTFDPFDGSRSRQFLTRINAKNFQSWLQQRKVKWQSRWKVSVKRQHGTLSEKNIPAPWTNPMFATKIDGKTPIALTTTARTLAQPIPYDDNFLFDPYDGSRHQQYLVPITPATFENWLQCRKQKWRKRWKVYELEASEEDDHYHHHCHQLESRERLECTVRYEFWKNRFDSIDQWLSDSTARWRKSYSWNSRKRKCIQEASEEVVQLPTTHESRQFEANFWKWLSVRKNQWRILRRKRQRRLEDDYPCEEGNNARKLESPEKQHHSVSVDFVHIDAFLEEKELEEKQKKERAPIDISFLFYPSKGCPDDVVVHCLKFLHHSEYPKLLCINKSSSEGLKSRSSMWQLLCPAHWRLPRLPRKPWHELYFSKLRLEERQSQKQWDDLLLRISEVLSKGDQLRVIQKLIGCAEKKFAFKVDYISGVVCERNAILNLAVINKRHKVVHWLVEEKHADIETSDRGYFTPLINAAWGGDKNMVRFLLSRGADRRKVGLGHSSEALAHPDFQGLTAEGWARNKGHNDIAELLRLGL